jgi:hypothetical protein
MAEPEFGILLLNVRDTADLVFEVFMGSFEVLFLP